MDLAAPHPRCSFRLFRRRDRVRLLAQAAAFAPIVLLASRAVLAQYEVPDPQWNPPTHYYDNAAGMSGNNLRNSLHTIVSTMTARSYGDSRYNMATHYSNGTAKASPNQDPSNADHIILYYNDASIPGTWDAGVTWNREHVWPKALLNLTSSQVDNTYVGVASDWFELQPANPSINSSRSDNGYGYWVNNSTPGATYGSNSNGGTTYWNPGALDRGDAARAIFYMATRYITGTVAGSHGTSNADLELKNGAPTLYNFGDKNSLLHWNYTDGVSNFERRRNQYIYGSSGDLTNHTLNPTYYQGNRNPYVDHPEYVWSVWGDTANNSQISLAGATIQPDGSSAQTVAQRVMKNGTLITSNVTINKTGSTPTTYDITVAGEATTAAAGTGQPFDYGTVNRSISLGLTSSTATTGLKTGTITINNTDIDQRTVNAGQGLLDGNDVVTVQAQVLDNRVVNVTPAAFGRVLVGANISTNTSLTSSGDDDHFTRITVKANASAADTNGVFITAGAGDVTFNGTVTNTTRALQGNFATPGDYSGSRTFTIQGESLAGETDAAITPGYTARAVAHAQPSFASGSPQTSQSVDFGYVPAGFAARSAGFSVYNNSATADPNFTAGLDIDGSSTAGLGIGQMTTNVVATNPNSPLAANGSISYTATYTPTTGGVADATHTINSSDENLPGAAGAADLTFTAHGYTLTSATIPQSGFMKLFAGETYNTGPFAIQNSSTLLLNGPGTMNITGAQSHDAGATLSATDGVINVNTDAGSPAAPNLALSASGSSNVTFSATQHLASLNVAGTTVSVAAGANKVIVTGNLSLDATAHLDLSDNKLIVRNGILGTINGDTYSGITGLVQSGRNGGAWNAPGLNTSQSTAQSSSLTTLAVAAASDARGIAATETTTWSGETVNGSDVLVMYTYSGDATLDGKINIDDYTKIDSGIANTLSGWSNGDFNYDGKINIDDYTVIDSNVINQGAPFDTTAALNSGSIGAVAAVPEPASFLLCATFATGGLLLRRSRRRRR